MKRYFLGAALSSVLLCAPVMAQDAAVETAAQDAVIAPADVTPAATPAPNAIEPPLISAPVAGYTYFHRAGATMEEHQADLAACRPAVLAMVYREAGSDVVRSGAGTGTYAPV